MYSIKTLLFQIYVIYMYEQNLVTSIFNGISAISICLTLWNDLIYKFHFGCALGLFKRYDYRKLTKDYRGVGITIVNNF